MKVDVILGLQWGDEGKGKIVDALAPNYDVIARFQGGPNAGHTIIFNNKKFVLHTVPSGIFRSEILNIIGNGVVLDPVTFFKEIDQIRSAGFEPISNLMLSNNAHLIMPSHRLLDAVNEAAMGNKKIGSTLKGIGPTYTDKYKRVGLRIGDILKANFKEEYEFRRNAHFEQINSSQQNIDEYKFDGLCFDDYEKEWLKNVENLKEFKICATEIAINKSLSEGKNILAEGAQGTLLDVDFGSYPYVTSSNTMTGGVCTGLGVAPTKIGKVFGIFKAYCTRVGNGPFPTELFDEIGEQIRKNGNEFGATTGRPRRTGWIDLPALRYATMINGVTDLIMTKADVLSQIEDISICTAYIAQNKEYELPEFISGTNFETVFSKIKGWNDDITNINNANDFPNELKKYIDFIEKATNTPITFISTGPDRNQIVKNRL